MIHHFSKNQRLISGVQTGRIIVSLLNFKTYLLTKVRSSILEDNKCLICSV